MMHWHQLLDGSMALTVLHRLNPIKPVVLKYSLHSVTDCTTLLLILLTEFSLE